MIISIAGGTGFVGKRLVQRLLADKHEVHVLTRSKSSALSVFPADKFPGVIIVEEGEWKNSIQSSTAVVNLAGRNIMTKWTPQVKKEIWDSRINTTAKVVDLINNTPDECRPKVFINGSACGYYGSSETAVLDEKSPPGNDYLAKVCVEWENTAQRVKSDVRLIVIRTGLVLGQEGGALASMIPAFKMYAGGPMGSGRQWVPWIHVDDHVSLMYTALTNPSYKGIFNLSAPNPVRGSDLCTELGSVLGRPSWLRKPECLLKFLLNEGACVILDGQNMIPSRALELGFSFKYPHLREALKEICLGKE